jgi:hypothetical protein
VVTTTILMLNAAIAQQIIKDKPTPSRAEWAIVTQETATISQNIGRTIAGEMHNRIIEEMRKRAQKL